jgi:hypothetical protein
MVRTTAALESAPAEAEPYQKPYHPCQEIGLDDKKGAALRGAPGYLATAMSMATIAIMPMVRTTMKVSNGIRVVASRFQLSVVSYVSRSPHTKTRKKETPSHHWRLGGL